MGVFIQQVTTNFNPVLSASNRGLSVLLDSGTVVISYLEIYIYIYIFTNYTMNRLFE